jgi:Uncharacterized protein conserved in bacteria (DUF2252)
MAKPMLMTESAPSGIDSTDFVTATADFERWLAAQTPLDAADLEYKHTSMADRDTAFPFLRATFYRWLQIWPKVCPDLAHAPVVQAVGDLHVENFGTWRDEEGRLAWGINDFDEACRLPYTQDLVRLAASGIMAAKTGFFKIRPTDIVETILDGYTTSLQEGGRPFVLAERNGVLRELAIARLRDPKRFWSKLTLVEESEEPIPADAREALMTSLPASCAAVKVYRRRRVGLGSLGKGRFVVIGEWDGGRVARECKALTPSAAVWAMQAMDLPSLTDVVSTAVRCPDPFFHTCGPWVVRRLAPDCSRIDLATLVEADDKTRMFRAMGWETANVHLAQPDVAAAILRDLDRPADWLLDAAGAMIDATRKDWKEWRKQARS